MPRGARVAELHLDLDALHRHHERLGRPRGRDAAAEERGAAFLVGHHPDARRRSAEAAARLGNGCAEHADDHFCPTAAGQNFTLHSVHPKLNKFTPFGMYRSRQTYYGNDNQVIGCVDMLVPYEK